MKKDYKKPDIEDLVPGNILPVYQNYTEELLLEGNALLLQYQPSWRPELPYVRYEIGGTDKQDPHTINWSYQRWLIEFQDGPQKGLKTHRYISYFLCVNNYLSSEYFAEQETGTGYKRNRVSTYRTKKK